MALNKSSLREDRLWPSAQKIKTGQGSREEHAALVNAVKPVRPYSAPVPPASDAEVHDALSKDKKPNAFAPRELEDGTPVAVRLDIPAYEQKNTWVVSVHHPKSDFTAGPIIGYDSVAHIDNPKFGVHPTGALNIASGKPKSTIATVHGNWRNITPEAASEMAGRVHHNPEWRQVGMDPERHSYFYDRETQQPVVAADEALHIGPLVYAKNPVYDNPENYKFSNGGEVNEDGITAYHGSPHDFEQFDTSQIGTGEGAQHYGHGLYFAQNEDVAKGYRDNLSGGPTHVFFPHGDDDRYVPDSLNDPAEQAAARAMLKRSGSLGYKQALRGQQIEPETAVRAMKLIKNGEIKVAPPGHMYEVHINAHPDHFIDWDAPLSEQHPDVWQKLVRGPSFIKNAVKDGILNNKTYGDIHGTIVVKHPRGQQGVSEHMAEMGIPGIKYLDAGSRGSTAEPTRNYVVFDHSHVSVKRKYAKGGMVEGSPTPAPAAKKVALKKKPAIDWDKKRDGGPIVRRALMVISKKV